jgi:hypothetical protein
MDNSIPLALRPIVHACVVRMLCQYVEGIKVMEPRGMEERCELAAVASACHHTIGTVCCSATACQRWAAMAT